MLALLGVGNSSLGRTSLAIALFAMFSGQLLYHMLRDLRLDTPFTDANVRRIRWLALLLLSIGAYNYLAPKALQALVTFALGDGRRYAPHYSRSGCGRLRQLEIRAGAGGSPSVQARGGNGPRSRTDHLIMPIIVHLDVMLARRKMSLSALAAAAAAVDITLVNLSVLKRGKAKATRFSTLEAICRAVQCQPADLLEYVPDEPSEPGR